MVKLDPAKFGFNLLSENDNLNSLDFTEDNGTDPLGVNSFVQEKSSLYSKNKLSAVWVVRYEGELIGFFSLSMFAIEVRELAEGERVEGATPRSYPAALLGQMGVDKKQRRRGIGYWICQFCIGLAQEVGKRIACRYIVLQTNQDKFSFYQKIGFISSEAKNQDKILMYLRLS